MSSHISKSNKAGLVSIITPTYNRAHYLKYAIKAALEQTYINFELIVVDDGSTDGTASLMENFLTDDRIKYVKTDNHGQAAARNTGISYAQGEFISFLDSDDRWFADKLEKSVNVLNGNPQVDILYGDRLTINSNGDVTSSYNMKRYSGNITKYLLRDNCVSFSTTIVRKKCFDEMGSFLSSDRLNEDYELWLRFSTRYQFYYLKDYLSYYRISDGQLSASVTERLEANELLLKTFLESHSETLSQQDIKNGWAHFYTRKGDYLASKGSNYTALENYTRALGYNLWLLYPWKSIAKIPLSLFRRKVTD